MLKSGHLMGLSAGTKLGPYEILSPLGAGGMGEVYRAHDTKLARDVALKVLPEIFAANSERMARFEREAQVLASLNHPNIAAIYGLEESGAARALVMELVEGETLADHLKSGPIRSDDALPIARQIADALEYAHERGIIHRDLKPANIKITPEGTVKVLDFGLAKALDPGATSSPTGTAALQDSPTLTAAATQAGVIMGTAAYMSPEQARGKTVDRRADIWAFGCVLYEMLTGKRPFEGETVTDVLAAVLTREPDWSMLPPAASPAIRRLLRRCLDRNLKNRLHDIADARITIDEILGGRAEDGPPASLADTPTSRLRSAVPWALAAVAAVWAIWATFQASRARTPRLEAAGVAFTIPWRSAEGPYQILRSVTLSRDGRRLMIWSEGGVLLRDLDHFTARTLALPVGTSEPFFSPDGEWIAFVADGRLQKVALAGGDPVKLCDVSNVAPGGAWGADGFIYFTPNWNGGLWRVAEEGGTPERISEPDPSRPGSFDGWPSPLPDGRGVLFTKWGAAGANDARIAYFDRTTRDIVDVAPGAAAQYLASGEVVFFRHGSWFAAPFDPRLRKLTGPVRRVLEEMRPLYPTGDSERDFSFSDNGRLAYVAGANAFNTPYTQLAWIDRAGRIERLPFEGRHETQSLALSPDNRRAAVVLAEDGELQVWVYDLASGTRERLTRDGQNMLPRWSPDGASLVVTSQIRGNFDLRLVGANGLAPPRDLVTTPADDYQGEWTPDGRTIVFAHPSPQSGVDIWARGVDEVGRGKPVIGTPETDEFPSLSPDGHWLLFRSQSGLYVTSFPEGRERTKIWAGKSVASWSPSTPEVFVFEADRMVSIRYEVSGNRFRATGSQVFFEAPRLAIEGRIPVSHDARRFLIFVPVPGKTLDPELRVVTDGFAVLRAQALSDPR